MATVNYYRAPQSFTNPGTFQNVGAALRRMASKLSSVITEEGSLPTAVNTWLTTGWSTGAAIPSWGSGISLQDRTWKLLANEIAKTKKYGRVSDAVAFQAFLTEVATIGAVATVPTGRKARAKSTPEPAPAGE